MNLRMNAHELCKMKFTYFLYVIISAYNNMNLTPLNFKRLLYREEYPGEHDMNVFETDFIQAVPVDRKGKGNGGRYSNNSALGSLHLAGEYFKC